MSAKGKGSGEGWRVKVSAWEWVSRSGGVTRRREAAGVFERARADELAEEFYRLYGDRAEVV